MKTEKFNLSKKFINLKARELAKELHKEEHLIINKKIDNNHKLEDWYYLMASGIYQNLAEKLDKISISKDDLFEIKEQMKELAKQQKYMWQTIEDEILPIIKKAFQDEENKKEDTATIDKLAGEELIK